MQLGIKMILILGAVIAAALVAQIGVVGRTILPSFDAVERSVALERLDRVEAVIDAEIEQLDGLAGDWAVWADSYHFLKAPADGYDHEELVYGSLASGSFDLFGLYTPQGDLVWGAVSDREINGVAGLADDLSAILRERLPLRLRALPEAMKGMAASELAPLMVTARPVTPSATGDQPLGKLLIARFLDQAAVEEFSHRSGADFTLKDAPSDASGSTGAGAADSAATWADHYDPDQASAVGLRRDILGAPLLTLQVAAPVGMMDAGRQGLADAVTQFFVIALVVFFLIFLAMQLVVLRPLTQLARRLVMIGYESDLRARLNERRRDVIGLIAREIDELLEKLSAVSPANGSKGEQQDSSLTPLPPKANEPEG